MKKAIYLFAVAIMAIGFVSCNNEGLFDFGDDNNGEEQSVNSADAIEEDIELRAMALGYSDTESYIASVAAQCAAGNHENCDLLDDGTHQACTYPCHTGTKHDGSHHGGSNNGCDNDKGHHQHCTGTSGCDPATCTEKDHNHGGSHDDSNHKGGHH